VWARGTAFFVKIRLGPKRKCLVKIPHNITRGGPRRSRARFFRLNSCAPLHPYRNSYISPCLSMAFSHRSTLLVFYNHHHPKHPSRSQLPAFQSVCLYSHSSIASGRVASVLLSIRPRLTQSHHNRDRHKPDSCLRQDRSDSRVTRPSTSTRQNPRTMVYPTWILHPPTRLLPVPSRRLPCIPVIYRLPISRTRRADTNHSKSDQWSLRRHPSYHPRSTVFCLPTLASYTS
jgi:hypothetical protein